MGPSTQRALQKATAPVTAQVGPWLARARADLPALSDTHLMFLAGLHTTLAAQTIMAGAQTSLLDEGTQSPAAKFMPIRDSILRFERLDTSGQLTLGTPGNGLDWKTDWSLRYSISAATSEITVPEYRISNDEVANVERLDTIRTLLAETIARGPEWVITDGRPRPADYLTAIRRGREFSPLAGDYCDDLSEATLPSVRVGCVSGLLRSVALDIGHVTRRDPETGDWLIYLGPGGNRERGLVRVRALDEDNCEMVFPRAGSAPPIEAQRMRRRGLWLMRGLVAELEEDFPGVTVLNDSIAAVEQGPQDPAAWVQAWTDQTLSPQWLLTPGSVVPVAVVVTARRHDPIFDGHDRILDRMVDGAHSVVPRRRTFTRGMTGQKRAEGRVQFARNAAILSESDGSYEPYMRYVTTPDISETTVGLAAPDVPMFWEVFQADNVTDQATTSLLLTTGLGSTDATVAYGNELLAYLDAYCTSIDTDAIDGSFQTVGLRVPSA